MLFRSGLLLIAFNVFLHISDLSERTGHLLSELVDLVSESLVLGLRLIEFDLLDLDSLVGGVHLDVRFLLVQLSRNELLNGLVSILEFLSHLLDLLLNYQQTSLFML